MVFRPTFLEPFNGPFHVVSAGGFVPVDVPQAEADALIALYNATAGASWTNKTNWLVDTTVGNWYGITVSGGHVTVIDLDNNNLNGSVTWSDLDDLTSLTTVYLNTNASLSGNVGAWTLPSSLERFYVYSTSVSGDVSGWTLPNSLERFYVYSTSVSGDVSGWTLPNSLLYFQINDTSVSGDISGWTLPNSLLYFFAYNTSVSGDISGWTLPSSLLRLFAYNTSVSGDISGWTLPNSLQYFQINNTSVSGDISGWTLPNSLLYFQINNTSVSGDISGWTLPSSLRYFYAYSTSVSLTGTFAGVGTGLRDFQVQNCSMNQASVDYIVQSLYNARAGFTYATPSANVGGTNAAPSGTYQDGDPPTTGKEYIYELVVDPESEGFYKWVITYTA